MFKTEIIQYKDYGKCLSMTNGVIDVVTTLEVGPRIVRYGYVGGTNIMNDNKEAFAEDHNPKIKEYFGNDAYYRTYGGHRLWISPEWFPEIYYPDNEPVEYEVLENSVIFTPPVQKKNDIQMQIKVTLSDNENVEVEHFVTNKSDRNKEFSLWALTVAAKGGTEIIPMNVNDTHLLPNRKMVLWPYTDPRKDNIYIGREYLTIKQPDEGSLKFGLDLNNPTVYYQIDDTVFVKTYYPKCPNGVYPDGGVSYETYSCNYFTELETLSELRIVAPGETVNHIESWSLRKNPGEFDRKDDAAIKEFINKL